MTKNDSMKIIHTKYGTAQIDKGYYRISSVKEGNRNKMLHRLIFEDFYGEIPNGYIVHHKDGNKLNNCILNLQLMGFGEHTSFHNIGNNNMFGKKHSEESKKKMSIAQKGKIRSESHKTKLGKSNSKTRNIYGFFRVSQKKDSKYTQGFIWVYQCYLNKKRQKYYSTSLKGLKQKVVENGQEWSIVNEELAKASCEKYGERFEDLYNGREYN